MLASLFSILVFPGFVFLGLMGVAAEYLDRIIYARLQHRKGPPWFQPVADFIKLLGKEDVVPEEADVLMFRAVPIFALAAVITAFFYIPLFSPSAVFSFSGDLIVVLYLLMIPTMTFFLGAWYSRSLYATIGAVRAITQLFAYEVPLFLGLLAPAVIAGSWNIAEISAFYASHPLLILVNAIAFIVSIIALVGKLERVPFDIPEAETEIVAGTFTEYSGRLLAYFRMAIDMEVVVAASLVAAVFLPFGMELPAVFAFIIYLVRVVAVIFILSVVRTIFARLRIDQMVSFCWKYLAPIAFLQLVINIIVKGLIR